MTSLSLVYSRAQLGIKAPLVNVETNLANGFPAFSIVGLPETAVKESRDRVRSALVNSHFDFPVKRITVNLAPADLPKEGGRFDLPIAIGVLLASEQIPATDLSQYEMVGELALSGELRAIPGILPMALETKKANKTLIVPLANAEEASLVEGLTVLPVQHLMEVCEHFSGRTLLSPYQRKQTLKDPIFELDLSDVQEQFRAKRALEIAAAGEHSVLFMGPPGTGKTMLASRLPTILPWMTENQAIEAAVVASISHRGFHPSQWKKRPFRSPHHSASSIALVGGGNPPKPGEISLAHHGVLFLDELPEFNRHVLEALREPLESGVITISRAACQSEFPANFQLIAAMNPCPCGYLGDSERTCRCSPDQVRRYRARISGPLFDRIDMHVEVPRWSFSQPNLQTEVLPESSEQVRTRVEKSFARQIERQGKSNSKLSSKEIKKHIQLGSAEQTLLEKAVRQFKLSARSYHRILKVALTIADLAESPKVELPHLSEAMSFRQMEEIK